MSGTTTVGRIWVNDRPREVAAGASLADLVRELGLAERRGLAVAVNDSVVPRGEWAGRTLDPEDRVLVIQATQGG